MQLNFKKVDSSSGSFNTGDILFVNGDKSIYIVESGGTLTRYGGAEMFIVSFTGNASEMTADVSVEGIINAVEAGKSVMAQYNSLLIPLIRINNNNAIYSLTVAAPSLGSGYEEAVLSIVQTGTSGVYAVSYLEVNSNKVSSWSSNPSDTNYPSEKLVKDTFDNAGFYFVQGSSSQAGNSTSGSYLSTKWEGTVPDVSTAYDGLKIAYRIATNTGVSTAGVVLSIDGSNYYPVVIQKNTIVSTHYPVGATVLMVFNSTQTATAYLTSNSKSTVTGCWQIMEYDSNSDTKQREYDSSTSDVEYPITARYATTTGSSYYAEYGRYSNGVTLNPSTNAITASKFIINGGTSSQFLKAYGTTDSNVYALASAIPAAQVQSDWSQGDPLEVDYIKNKPNIAYIDNSLGKYILRGYDSIDPTHILGDNGYLYAIGSDNVTGNEDKVLATVDQIPSKVSDLQNDSGFTTNTGTITGITMNGVSKGTSGNVDLGTVITSHQDISGKADASAAIGSLSLTLDSNTYQITLSGTKVDGSTFTVSNVIDLPLESVVVNGSYNNSTKKVVLTLQNGNTVEFSVADLVAGLQSEITTSNKLASNLIVEADPIFTASAAYGITSANITTWNNKQNALTWDTVPTENSTNPVTSGGLYTVITTNELVTSTALNDLDSRVSTLEENSGSGGITTETDPVFTASAAYGISASDITNWNNKVSNVQSDWNATTGAAVILNKPTIPTQTTDASVSGWGYIKSYTESDPVFTASPAYDITAEDMTFWSNKSEITSIKMNGSAVTPTAITTHSYEVDLGTVITSHATHKLNATNGTASAVNQGTEITYVESVSGTTTATSGDLSVSTTRKKVTIPTAVTESTVSGWGFTKNEGTLTSHATHKLNATNGTATAVNQGTEITYVESVAGTTTATSGDLSVSTTRKKITVPAAANNATLTIKKNGTSIGTFSANASADTSVNITVNDLPTVSASDNGKILQVVNGQWTLVTPISVYSGSNVPNNSLGNDGDIYIQS